MGSAVLEKEVFCKVACLDIRYSKDIEGTISEIKAEFDITHVVYGDQIHKDEMGEYNRILFIISRPDSDEKVFVVNYIETP